MARQKKTPDPFRWFDSSPGVIRLVVMMYVRYPLSLRNVEDLLFERGIDICHETELSESAAFPCVSTARFLTGFGQGNRYSIDRLVAAANMFDLIPKTHVPKTMTIEPGLAGCKGSLRKAIPSAPG